MLITEFILIGHGIKFPSQVAEILIRLIKEIDDLGSVLLLAVTHIWYSILSRLPGDEINDNALNILRNFVSDWLNTGKNGYGVVQYNNDVYQYYPLAYYAAIWTKVHAGVDVDLLLEYQERGYKDNDEKLHQHIIASFSDFRQLYSDYPTALKILLPYLQDPTTNNVHDILVSSVGSLRGRFPVLIDDFMRQAKVSTA